MQTAGNPVHSWHAEHELMTWLERERHVAKCNHRPPAPNSYHPLPIHLVKYASELGLEVRTRALRGR
eukprot:1188487-Prorocentrum_minimum.AAC.5